MLTLPARSVAERSAMLQHTCFGTGNSANATAGVVSGAYAGLKVHPDRASWCIADGEMVHRHR